jgi:hypothetical protein
MSRIAYPYYSDVSSMPLAMAYVPWSRFGSIYEPDAALEAGTIFMDLNKPFIGRRACPR